MLLLLPLVSLPSQSQFLSLLNRYGTSAAAAGAEEERKGRPQAGSGQGAKGGLRPACAQPVPSLRPACAFAPWIVSSPFLLLLQPSSPRLKRKGRARWTHFGKTNPNKSLGPRSYRASEPPGHARVPPLSLPSHMGTGSGRGTRLRNGRTPEMRVAAAALLSRLLACLVQR